MENKNDKFIRLATRRVNNAIRQIRLIGNLSNTSTYEFSDDEAEQIFRAVKRELRDCESRFQNALAKKSRGDKANPFEVT